MKAIGAILLIALLHVSLACDGEASKDIEKEVTQALNEGRRHLALNKDEYLMKVESELALLDARIRELNKKAARSGASTRVEMMREIQALLGKREELRKNLDRLKPAGAKAVEKAASEIDAALKDLKESCEKTISRFK
jgi:CHASE3 domain sensor protein